jgi:hypothetical protein
LSQSRRCPVVLSPSQCRSPSVHASAYVLLL